MCGICGIVNFDSTDPVSPRLLEAMTGIISHRGPDDFGYFRDGGIGLGHRRLSIIDLSGGRQPMFGEDGNVVVVFNGEIYNYQEINAELEARGHTFKTRSDTETIVHAYEEYGDECVTRFRGMFAFALWDRVFQRLLVVRDRLGIKPLYFYHDRRSLLFGSEIKSLLESPDVPREVDEAALNLYLSLRYVPGPRTMFRHISKLQPGHLMVVEHGQVRIRKYWDVPCRSADGPASDPKQFGALLEESVSLRMIADVPLGVFLSGGIDSSAILAMMSRLRQGEPVKTFSIGYESPQSGYESPGGSAGQSLEEHNEFAYARQAAEAFGAEHHEFKLCAFDFRDFIPQLIWHLDEPLADPSCIPLYFISRLAREHITVVLSGEGADEILGGYGIYPKMLAIEKARRFPGAGALAALLAGAFPPGRCHEVLRMAAQPLQQRYRGVSRGFRPSMQACLTGQPQPDNSLNTVALNAVALNTIYDALFDAVSDSSALDQMLYVDSKVWLPDDLLLKADKMTMANALELRVPFLDHKLVEYAAQLPESAKLAGGIGKALLRQTMKGILPESILRRSKKGFPVPTTQWLRGPLREFTRDTLLASDSACLHFFDPTALREIVKQHSTGADLQQELWTLLVFEHWHRAFVTAPRHAETMCSFDHSGVRH
jgi:asparagine synthase (glutamine-hydrolysing)